MILIVPRAEVALKAAGALGDATLNDTVYLPILDVLADHQPQTIGQLEQLTSDRGLTIAHVVEAVIVLTGTGVLHAVQDTTSLPALK